ncbi:TPA: hypothetical protein ACH3X1_003820 [Trebouxia sp. C0004]
MGPLDGWLQDKRLDADHPKVLYQAAADRQADLKMISQDQDIKTRNAAAGTIESCLTPAIGHHFDLLMGSVFHQLCVNGWHASALSTLFTTGVPAITGSQQVMSIVEAGLSELEAGVIAQQPEAFVGSPQACLFHRGAAVASHASPRVTQAVWSLCWGLSLFHRNSSHPPLAMLQDLQIPSHTHSATGLGRMAAEATVCMSLIIVAVQHSVLCVSLWPRSATAAASQRLAGCGIVELASTCLQMLCKRDGPMPVLRDSALSPSGVSISQHDTGQCTGRSASPVSQRRQQYHSLAFEPSTGRMSCQSEPTDVSSSGTPSENFSARACMLLHESMESICQHTLQSGFVRPHAPKSAAKTNSSQQAGALGQQGCDAAQCLEGQPAITAGHGVHSANITNVDSNDGGQQAPAIKMTIGFRACQQQQPDDAVTKRITGCLGDNAAFACHT